MADHPRNDQRPEQARLPGGRHHRPMRWQRVIAHTKGHHMTQITNTIDTNQGDEIDTEPTEANLARWDSMGDDMAMAVVRHARRHDEWIGGVCFFTFGKLAYALASQGWDEEMLISQVRKRFADAREQ